MERLADAAADRAHTRFIVSDDPEEVVEQIARLRRARLHAPRLPRARRGPAPLPRAVLRRRRARCCALARRPDTASFAWSASPASIFSCSSSNVSPSACAGDEEAHAATVERERCDGDVVAPAELGRAGDVDGTRSGVKDDRLGPLARTARRPRRGSSPRAELRSMLGVVVPRQRRPRALAPARPGARARRPFAPRISAAWPTIAVSTVVAGFGPRERARVVEQRVGDLEALLLVAREPRLLERHRRAVREPLEQPQALAVEAAALARPAGRPRASRARRDRAGATQPRAGRARAARPAERGAPARPAATRRGAAVISISASPSSRGSRYRVERFGDRVAVAHVNADADEVPQSLAPRARATRRSQSSKRAVACTVSSAMRSGDSASEIASAKSSHAFACSASRRRLS